MTNAAAPQANEEPLERRKFQLTDLKDNSNKFYLVEIWPRTGDEVFFRATYGRVGATPQVSTKITTRRWVEGKIREKIRGGYQEVALHRPAITIIEPEEPLKPVEERVRQVVDWIYTEARENIASYLAVGLDSLSGDQIDRGRKLLALAQRQHSMWDDTKSDDDWRYLSGTVERYYNTIPTKLPSRIKLDKVIENFCGAFDEQEERLNQLEAAIATQTLTINRPQMTPYEALGAELEAIDHADPAYQSLAAKVISTLSHGYKVSVKDIFRVVIEGERQAFLGNQRGRDRVELLFHGTAGQNVRHIMRSGLICPRTPSNGRMFGHGIYFASQSSKSINYCHVRSRKCPQFLFLTEVALGKQYVADDAMSSLREAPNGYDSVWGKANHTGAWGGKLQFDEYIIYSAAQQTIRYLVTFERG